MKKATIPTITEEQEAAILKEWSEMADTITKEELEEVERLIHASGDATVQSVYARAGLEKMGISLLPRLARAYADLEKRLSDAQDTIIKSQSDEESYRAQYILREGMRAGYQKGRREAIEEAARWLRSQRWDFSAAMIEEHEAEIRAEKGNAP